MRRSWAILAGAAVLIVGAGGCGGGDEEEEAAPTAAATTEQKAAPNESGPVTIAAPSECGDPVVYEKADPDGVLAELPDEVQEWFEPYPFEVRASRWADSPAKEGPWTIGYVSFPIVNPFKVSYFDQLKKEFAAAKDAGLVTGELQTFIQPSFDTATPEQQSAAIAEMVSNGVDGIILHPLNAVAVTPAIDAAGEAGVPVVLTGDVAPGSEYAVNTLTENQSPAFAAFLRLLRDDGWFEGERRTALSVQGIAGNSFSEQVHGAAEAALEPCEGVDVVGTVWGQWDPATTKSEVLKFLASYTGELDFVMHEGAMASGVIQAFEDLGRPVPPMPISGFTGGDLSWWLEHRDTYDSAGIHTMGGRQVAYTTFRILLRILAGNGLKIRDIAPRGNVVTSENVDEYAVPGHEVTWLEDIHFRGPLDAWLSNEQMDNFFKEPGTPGGL
jgi:ribose transport system substrate-binding protein